MLRSSDYVDTFRLKRFLTQYSLTIAPPGEVFTLASGATSTYFINGKNLTLRADGLNAVAACMRDLVMSDTSPFYNSFDCVAGVALGGCPLATGLSLELDAWAIQAPALYVRGERKDHGTRQSVEGPFHKGQRVLLLEDVVTTGTSTLRAIRTLESEGLEVKGIISIVDRQQGGDEALSGGGYLYCPLVLIEELLPKSS